MEAATAAQRWAFLDPWWPSLQSRLFYRDLEIGPDQSWAHQRRRHLVVQLEPQSYNIPFFRQTQDESAASFTNLRDALSLLSAVYYVDPTGWRYLLSKLMSYFPEETYEEARPRFVLEVKNHVERDLVQFCGIYQRNFPSPGYVAALAKIATTAKLQEKGKGLEIQVPVRVCVAATIQFPMHEASIDVFQTVQAAERVISQQWRRYKYQPVRPGAIRATFVLEPMIADFTQFMRTSNTALASTIGKLMADNMWFSKVSVRLTNERAQQSSPDAIGQLVTTLFDSTRRYRELANTKYYPDTSTGKSWRAPLQLGKVYLHLDYSLKGSDYEAIFSAMLLNQSTKKLSMYLRMDRGNRSSSSHWWKWLAYAFFSRRARASSALESLALAEISTMTTADMVGFLAVVASDHPEEELCGTSRGRLEERVATLKPGCQIHQLHAIPGQQRRSFTPVTLPTATDQVRTFSDDRSSALVNAMIPGRGWCQVKRCDLQFQEVLEVDPRPHCLAAVSIQFDYSAQSSGLPQFLAAVGSSLKKLSLGRTASAFDLNGILRSCPKLQALCVHQGLVEVDFSFESHTASLPHFNWDNIDQLANELSDTSSPFAQCVRRLALRLVNLEDPDGGLVQYERTTDVYLEALLSMLEANKTLEYLKVTVPWECEGYEARFKAHHNSPVQRSLQLPLETKLAFLSVQSVGWVPARASKRAKKAVGATAQPVLGGLDEHVTSKIFQFAARLVRRQVHFNWEYNENTPPEDC